jgi:hypothetical protein
MPSDGNWELAAKESGWYRQTHIGRFASVTDPIPGLECYGNCSPTIAKAVPKRANRRSLQDQRTRSSTRRQVLPSLISSRSPSSL